MKSRVLKGLVPWSGLGVGALAIGGYFCGHAETAVCLLACAVLVIGMGILAFVGLVALSWLPNGLALVISRFGPPPALG